MLNTDLCGSYNLTLEELCKPFPFWSNCTPTEFNVVAYSAAGASVPSAAVFVNGMSPVIHVTVLVRRCDIDDVTYYLFL